MHEQLEAAGMHTGEHRDGQAVIQAMAALRANE